MFDTHAHIEMLDGELSEMLDRAALAGVDRILAVGSSEESNRQVIDAVKGYPGRLFAAVGLDRNEAQSGQSAELVAERVDKLRQVATDVSGAVRAIGEIGLDYHYRPETASEQRILLEAQLELACELRLPVIIHSRDADEDTLSILKRHAARWQGNPAGAGVIHCFTRSIEFAREAVGLGFMISFSGILTFKKSQDLRNVAVAVPEKMLLVETDAPFLAPEPMRGRMNEPSFLSHTLKCLAALRGVSSEEMESITDANAERLLNL